MGKPLLLCVIFATIFISSCNFYTTPEKLYAYQRISGINDTLDKMTVEWHRLLDKAVSGKNYSNLRYYREAIGTFLSRKRTVVANLKMNSDSQNLIDSEEVFLNNQATVVSDLYSNFESFNDMTPDESIQNQLKLVVGDQANEAAASAAIRGSLKAFWNRNDLEKKQNMIPRP